MTRLLEAVRLSPLIAQFRFSRGLARILSRRGKVHYRVIGERMSGAAGDPPRDARSGGRRKSRLESAKILDRDGRFLGECLISDRSPSGMRLHLTASLKLPDQLLLYDDAANMLRPALKIWRRGSSVGVRLTGRGETRLRCSMTTALRTSFYAVRD